MVAADRAGLFGSRPAGDSTRYHNRLGCVVAIVDGDTIDVDQRDELTGFARTRIRLWGVDTPETVRPETPPQHFGAEASARTKSLCLGQTVRIELVEGKTRDKYDRLLAYIHLPDGRMLNRVLVAEGCAYADPRFKHPAMREFRSLQNAASKAQAGLWKNVTAADLPYYYRGLKLPTRPADQQSPTWK